MARGPVTKRPPGWVRLPAYVRLVKAAGGAKAYYFELPPWARPTRNADGTTTPAVRDGRRLSITSQPLGSDLAAAITKGEALNQVLATWRTGEGGAALAKGTVGWLFAWYRDQDRFKKNAAKTRGDYRKLMDMLAAFEPKAGSAPLGQRMANRVDAGVADKLYKKLRERGGGRHRLITHLARSRPVEVVFRPCGGAVALGGGALQSHACERVLLHASDAVMPRCPGPDQATHLHGVGGLPLAALAQLFVQLVGNTGVDAIRHALAQRR